ncbi:uncharacterized protein Bfra_001883 [Botrytis fragariae]|uniref:Uncharacterized protein n=1 Tax=Botrytis fragariae TaxID=1964551 RepID=A0A8H6EM96_9HELO|nr:uncharacterized protein Bfra_001883 [Botrytis fragariae]KAF5877516.1 hypothetical protein Bfra_001883 [Botrytis fragariae]
MLRRNSSSRPSRSKSTLSTYPKHDFVDPEESRMHAHAAAMHAFNRAQERNGTSYGNKNGLSRSNTTSQENQWRSSQQNGSTSLDNPGLKHQQSVRFAGPNAVKRRQSMGKRTDPLVLNQKPSTATLRPVVMTTNTPVPAVYRPPSRSSSIGKASLSKSTVRDYSAHNYVTNLDFDEYYTQENDVASTPSSYRRIRKSKSMFSPLSAPTNVFYSNGSPDRTNCSSTPRTLESNAQLRAPNSMGFLRGGRDYFKSTSSCERNDDAVQMARDRFFVQATQQRLREQPSFLFRSKAQRQEKPFRKSVRSSSGKSAATYNSAESIREGGLRAKARKVSQGLKSKLRRVFGRSKEQPVAIPNQQVDAIETHVRAYGGNYHPIMSPRVPSLRAIASSQRLRSQSGSIRSLRSDHSDEKSRVTSWTNSTANNTVTSQGLRPPPSRDQRLSIINESGTHISKATFHRPNVKNQHPAYPAFHRPGHIQPIRPGGVDSARLCSALMKRLDESSPEAILAKSKKASTDTLGLEKVPRRSSSFTNALSQPRPWIRQVPPDCEPSNQSQNQHPDLYYSNSVDPIPTTSGEELFGQAIGSEHQFNSADLPLCNTQPQNQDDVFSSHPGSSHGNSFHQVNSFHQDSSSHQRLHQRNSKSAHRRHLSDIDAAYDPVQDPSGLTPQQVAQRDDPIVPKPKVIREARSAFFGGTTFAIDRIGNTSPYRRALAESENSAVYNEVSMAPVNDDVYSESVYSRSIGRNLSEAMSSDTSVPLANVRMPTLPVNSSTPNGGGSGGAVIINSTTYRPTHPRQRGDNSGGSIEWQKWMSSEVAKLERPSGNDRVSVSNIERSLSPTPTMSNSFHIAHRREKAQMADDDTDIAQKKLPVGKQPLGLIQQNLNTQVLLKPILKNRSTTSLAENAFIDNTIPCVVSPAPPLPPPLPLRSTLRPAQSKSSLKSTSNSQHAPITPSSPTHAQNLNIKARNVLHKRVSSATLRSAPTTPNHGAEKQTQSTRNVLHKRNVSDATMKSCKSIRSVKSFDTSVSQNCSFTTSPAKLVKRSGRPVYNFTPQSSPGTGIGAAVERQFGSASAKPNSNTHGSLHGTGRSRVRASGRENERVGGVVEGVDGVYGVEGGGVVGLNGLGVEQQQVGSKLMVDRFLSSRRKRIASVGTIAGGSMGEDGGGGSVGGMGDGSVFL